MNARFVSGIIDRSYENILSFNGLSLRAFNKKYESIQLRSHEDTPKSLCQMASSEQTVLRHFIHIKNPETLLCNYFNWISYIAEVVNPLSVVAIYRQNIFPSFVGDCLNNADNKGDNRKMGTLGKESRDQVLKPVYGIKRSIIDFEETIIQTLTRQIKGKYGIELTAWYDSEISIITDWIRENDPNFKQHITNPYALEDTKEKRFVVCGVFFLKVAPDTYIFVDAEKYRFKTKDNDERAPIYMYIFGKKAPSVFKKLSSFITTKNTTSNKIYSIVGVKEKDGSYWNCTASKLTPRTIDTIFMDAEQKKRITDHIDQWVKNEKMYTERGLMFKTGILLHGKAGTGKSSLAMAIANYLGCGLITIDPTTFQYMHIPEITESIVADETTYVVLIDEIDTLFVSRDNEDSTELQKEKTAKLLAFLDSPQSPTNVVFVATTNYINRLDNALLRKGRFDIIEEMGDISRPVAEEMCKSFELSDAETATLLGDTTQINPAQLQDMILVLIKKKEQAKAEEELERINKEILKKTDEKNLDGEAAEPVDNDIVKCVYSNRYDATY